MLDLLFMDAPRELATLFWQYEAFKWDPRNGFVLASGETSPYYVDCRALLAHPDARWLVAQLAYAAIRDLSLDAVGGLEIGAIPLATAISDYAFDDSTVENLRAPLSFANRPKEHGLGKQIEGATKPNDRVLVVDDVLTSGGSILQALQAAKEAQPPRLSCTRDRGPARTRMVSRKSKRKGCRLTSLLTLDELKGRPTRHLSHARPIADVEDNAIRCPEKIDDRIEVIAPNLKRRLSGVTATIARLLPVQARSIGIVATGPGLPAHVPCVPLRSVIRMSGRAYRVWHARRNTEMLMGLVLRHVFRKRLKLVFTSASQRHHTRYTRLLISGMDAVVATSRKSASYLRRSVARDLAWNRHRDVPPPTQTGALTGAHSSLSENVTIGCYRAHPAPEGHGRVRQRDARSAASNTPG